MSFSDTVLAVLPTEGGITYSELRKALGNRARSQIGTALTELERAGKARREPIPKPKVRDRAHMDLSRMPRVCWRRIA